MRYLSVVESVPTELDITSIEASALVSVGQALVAKVASSSAPEESEQTRRTMVRCSMNQSGKWSLSIDNAIGVLSIEGLQVSVQPKVPLNHLLFLLARANVIPRFIQNITSLPDDSNFVDLMARWYLVALQRLLKSDLARDYQVLSDDLKSLRGRLEPLRTSRSYYAGRFSLACSFEDFDHNIALNRVLKAAASRVAAIATLSEETKRRARLFANRFDGVGNLLPDDLRVSLDRRTGAYSDSLVLAKVLLRNTGRGMLQGTGFGWSFLLPTPLSVEAGIKSILREYLSPICTVTSRSISVSSKTTVNPDLWFEGYQVVGDVKYKLFASHWNQPDLYQTVAFAAASRATRALVLGFAAQSASLPSFVMFGDLLVEPVVWPVDYTLRPIDAALICCAKVAEILHINRDTTEKLSSLFFENRAA